MYNISCRNLLWVEPEGLIAGVQWPSNFQGQTFNAAATAAGWGRENIRVQCHMKNPSPFCSNLISGIQHHVDLRYEHHSSLHERYSLPTSAKSGTFCKHLFTHPQPSDVPKRQVIFWKALTCPNASSSSCRPHLSCKNAPLQLPWPKSSTLTCCNRNLWHLPVHRIETIISSENGCSSPICRLEVCYIPRWKNNLLHKYTA